MEKDMTVGSPSKILIAFTLPMLLGNLFQQFYNVVDTIVVGNFVGADALAAVGASSTLVMIILCFAIGLSMGCSVLISQYYGAGQIKNMKQSVYVSMVFIFITGTVVSLICIFGAEWLLRLINIPENILTDAKTYFVVYSLGGIFVFIYNALSAMCRAIGDSKTPLYFLIVTSLLNVGGDLLFVLQFNMGVAGVAWATMISQGISAVGCTFYIYRRNDLLKIRRENCVFSFRMLKDLIVYAIPSTVQQCIVSFSLVALQGVVNSFGTAAIAGYTAGSKIDNFATQPLLSLSMAVTSFSAQNIGARHFDRVKKGLRASLLIVVVMCAVISLIAFFWGSDLIGLFIDDASKDVIDYGVAYIQIICNTYVIMGLMFCYSSVLRGAGDMTFFLSSSLINFAVRIILAYTLVDSVGFTIIPISAPIGWIIGFLISAIRYWQGGWKNKCIIRRGENEKQKS